MHATMYANWYGMTVDTRANRMAGLTSRRLGLAEEKIGRLLCGVSRRNYLGVL